MGSSQETGGRPRQVRRAWPLKVGSGKIEEIKEQAVSALVGSGGGLVDCGERAAAEQKGVSLQEEGRRGCPWAQASAKSHLRVFCISFTCFAKCHQKFSTTNELLFLVF